MLLEEIERLGAGVLDPRFPEVREFLIETYESALREWDLDGLNWISWIASALRERPVAAAITMVCPRRWTGCWRIR